MHKMSTDYPQYRDEKFSRNIVFRNRNNFSRYLDVFAITIKIDAYFLPTVLYKLKKEKINIRLQIYSPVVYIE